MGPSGASLVGGAPCTPPRDVAPGVGQFVPPSRAGTNILVALWPSAVCHGAQATASRNRDASNLNSSQHPTFCNLTAGSAVLSANPEAGSGPSARPSLLSSSANFRPELRPPAGHRGPATCPPRGQPPTAHPASLLRHRTPRAVPSAGKSIRPGRPTST